MTRELGNILKEMKKFSEFWYLPNISMDAKKAADTYINKYIINNFSAREQKTYYHMWEGMKKEREQQKIN